MKKKQNKWIVSAASTALVAAAVVPTASAASFTDIAKSDHKEGILALADAKIVGGYTDGTFRPNATLTQSNVIKFLGKWLVSEHYQVPADYNKKKYVLRTCSQQLQKIKNYYNMQRLSMIMA